MQSTLVMARALLKIFSRDRQAIFFTLFFPITFMVIFGFITPGEDEAIEIGKIKKTQNARVYDPERERAVLERVRAHNNGPLDNDGIQRLFERVMDECRRVERLASQQD